MVEMGHSLTELAGWSLLRDHAHRLSRLLVFQAATGGWIGPAGLLLLIPTSKTARHYCQFAWDEKANRCRVSVLDQSGNGPVEDIFYRRWLLRQAVMVLKSSARLVEQVEQSWTEAPSWDMNLCADCGVALRYHVQPGYGCPSRQDLECLVEISC